MFTGRRLDAESGLYYYRARYYRPDIGRFLQPDPIGYAAGLNQYDSVGSDSYTYDDNGNLANDGTYRYYYDCENRLTDVNDVNDDPIASYMYDFMGRRVRKVVYGSPVNEVTEYCYDGDQVIAEYDAGNPDVVKVSYIYGPGIDEPVYISSSAGSSYYHFDGLGNVVALQYNGQIVETYKYDVFGKVTIYDVNNSIIPQSAYNNPYMFTGRRLDAETGLYYYRARYYRPEIGRFLQADPIGYAAGLNLYTYCLNNPVNWTDPLGLWTSLAHPEAAAIMAGGGAYVAYDNVRNHERNASALAGLCNWFKDQFKDDNKDKDKKDEKDDGGGGGGKRCPSDSAKDAAKDINDGKLPKDPAWEKKGKNWHNKDTGESLHPHSDSTHHGPHTDYHRRGPGNGGRIYPDGTYKPK